MLKRILVAAVLTLGFLSFAGAQDLRFNNNGEFKIVQFTDLHYNHIKQESRIVFSRMDEVIKAEKPDLIVVTGDLIYSSPAALPQKAVMDKLQSYGIPFCTVFGNHDPERDLSKAELYDMATACSNCLQPARKGDKTPDYSLTVKGRDGSPAEILYFIDSNDHIFDENGKFVCYDWIHEDQVDWYKKTSEAYEAQFGAKLPAVMFFHIPIPEYKEALKQDDCRIIGTKLEPVCAPGHNSGLFDAIKERGDVMATFCGHDHDNDFAIDYKDVLLAYGRYTGGNTVYNDLKNGARIIILKEGQRSLDSYIRLKGGQIIDSISFPESFSHGNWETRPLDPECLEGVLPSEIFVGNQTHHVQGIAYDKEKNRMYMSFTTRFLVTDMQGNILGSVDKINGHLGAMTFDTKTRKVYASLEYKDDAIGGNISKSLGEATYSKSTFHVAVIDVDAVDHLDVPMDEAMTTLDIKPANADYSAKVRMNGKKYDHRFGCSGIDGVTIAPDFGGKGGEYLYVAYGIYSDTLRTDNDYQILLQYSMDEIRKGNADKFERFFVKTGNTSYGVQNLAYDPCSGLMLMAVYKGKKKTNKNMNLYAVSMNTAPEKLIPEGIPYQKKKVNIVKMEGEGWRFKHGSTGLCPLGDNLWYVSIQGKENGRHSCKATLFKWTGESVPFCK